VLVSDAIEYSEHETLAGFVRKRLRWNTGKAVE
jgi:hypothetical protein